MNTPDSNTPEQSTPMTENDYLNDMQNNGDSQQPTTVGSGADPWADTRTYSEEELNDPNKIQTTITDQRTPLVIMFGARTIGKTAALIRLTRYLESKGYSVKPDRYYRPAYDTHYQLLCDKFHDVVYSTTASGGTGVMSFMLVKVFDRQNHPICQIVEAPGEHYFDPGNVYQPFPRYLMNIFSMPNRKVWVFFEVKHWEFDDVVHRRYAERVENMKNGGMPLVLPRDKVVFACTKVDQREREVPFNKNGIPDIGHLYYDICGEYPVGDAGHTNHNIFAAYENLHPISRIWRPHNYVFVPFSAGTFTDGEYYVAGPDFYPAMLWDAIRKIQA